MRKSVASLEPMCERWPTASRRRPGSFSFRAISMRACHVALKEERLKDLLLDRRLLLGGVERDEERARLLAADEAEVPDRLAAELRILLALGQLHEPVGAAPDEERVHHRPLDHGRGLGLVERPQLVLGAHDPELLDGLAPQLGVGLGPGRGEDAALLARDHEAPEDGLLHLHVRGRGVDLAQGLAALRTSEHPQVLDGLPLQIRAVPAAGDLHHDLPRPRRPALAQDEERALAQPGRRVAREELLEHRDRPLRVHGHEAVQGHQLQVLVGARFRGSGAGRRTGGPPARGPGSGAASGCPGTACGGPGGWPGPRDGARPCSARRPSSRGPHRSGVPWPR